MIVDNSRNYRKGDKLVESFSSIENLKTRLNSKMVAVLNKSSGGSSDWTLNSNWVGAWDFAETVEQRYALIEIYIQVACPSWGCTTQQLDPGKDIIIKLIDELGFYEDENPYIGFIKTFYGENRDYILTEDDWIKLNDWGATELVSDADLKGTGFDRKNHIIFNVNVYKSGDSADDYVNYFQLLSDKNEVLSLNVYAIATYDGSPYGKLSKLTKDGNRGTGVYEGGDYREVRDAIFYIIVSKPLGDLHSIQDVKKAYKIGKDTHYKAEADELATGSSQIDLTRMVKDTINQVNNVLKTISKQLNKYIKQASKSVKGTRGLKKVQQIVDKSNQYLKDDKQSLQKYIDALNSAKNKKEFESIHKELANYVDSKLKTKKLLKDLDINLGTSDVTQSQKLNTKRQSWSEKDLKKAVDNLSNEEKKALVKYLREIGLIK